MFNKEASAEPRVAGNLGGCDRGDVRELTRKIITLAIAACAVAAIVASVASAKPPPEQWYTHVNPAGTTVCDQGSNGVTGPFDSQELCEASLAVPPVVIDVCSNLDGDQATAPDGYIANGDGTCSLADTGSGTGDTGDGTGDTGDNSTVIIVNDPPLAADHSDHVFLCYSKFGVETLPAVFTVAEAYTLVAGGGYFSPVAIPGFAAFGNNVGGYHLVCNPGANRNEQFGMASDDAGDQYGVLGIAAYLGHNGSDIGLYPVWK
jgi:hypothetical protein